MKIPIAILAGDSLHDLAFEILADKKTHKDPKIRISLIDKLSKGIQNFLNLCCLDLFFL